MNRFLTIALSSAITALAAGCAWTPPPGDPGAACAACSSCFGFVALFFVALLAINIAILVWVARDAKARGMSSPAGWLILIFFTGLIGLIMVKCPHCGNSSASPSSG
jgi:uncharacterized membrane protein YhaH (DUF805 family)